MALLMGSVLKRRQFPLTAVVPKSKVDGFKNLRTFSLILIHCRHPF